MADAYRSYKQFPHSSGKIVNDVMGLLAAFAGDLFGFHSGSMKNSQYLWELILETSKHEICHECVYPLTHCNFVIILIPGNFCVGIFEKYWLHYWEFNFSFVTRQVQVAAVIDFLRMRSVLYESGDRTAVILRFPQVDGSVRWDSPGKLELVPGNKKPQKRNNMKGQQDAESRLISSRRIAPR